MTLVVAASRITCGCRLTVIEASPRVIGQEWRGVVLLDHVGTEAPEHDGDPTFAVMLGGRECVDPVLPIYLCR